MENKLSKGGALRIKSPQAHPTRSAAKPGNSAPHLHSRAAKRSENRSAARTTVDSPGLDRDVQCAAEGRPDLDLLFDCDRCAAKAGGRCRLFGDEQDAGDVEASRPEAQEGGSGAQLPSGVPACPHCGRRGAIDPGDGLGCCVPASREGYWSDVDGLWYRCDAAPPVAPLHEGPRLLAERLLASPSHPVAGYCTCGAQESDHLARFGGYCILVKNHRTTKIPGALPLGEVRL